MNVAEATKWYKRAADKGNAEANYRLGYLSFKLLREKDGWIDSGAEMNVLTAVQKEHLLEAADRHAIAAAQGHAEAQFSLGMLWWVCLDQKWAALEMFKNAANKGHVEAQYIMIAETEVRKLAERGILMGGDETTADGTQEIKHSEVRKKVSSDDRGECMVCLDLEAVFVMNPCVTWYVAHAAAGD